MGRVTDVIHLRIRSEYSFRRAVGKLPLIAAQARGAPAMALTDTGTWGHVQWAKACKEAGLAPIFGAEVLVVADAKHRSKQPGSMMVLLAQSTPGLMALYEALSLANQEPRFYYVPRLDYADLQSLPLGDGLALLAGMAPNLSKLPQRAGVFLELMPNAPGWVQMARRASKDWPLVLTADNYYPRAQDRMLYQTIVPHFSNRSGVMHIADPSELALDIPGGVSAAVLAQTEQLGQRCMGVALPRASMVQVDRSVSLLKLCLVGAKARGLPVRQGRIHDAIYQARLERELAMIAEKKFEDYFRVIATMVQEAKRTMLVGPARGSAAGSLVCYLMGITDVDPLVHDLMFERFIDVTRADLPDIDLDFPDQQREQVFLALQERYGTERVGRLGTINRYAPDSAINDVAKLLQIPGKDLADLKGAILRRSSGDARAQMAVMDALSTLDIGKRLLTQFPHLRLAGELEGSARYSGMHAAGVVVTQEPLAQYGTVDRSGAIQVDKYDAEKLNLLKIDVLGLRTLTVIADCLAQIGKDHAWLRTYPLNDPVAFQVFNEERWAGIFQFEGYALQSLCRQMRVREFNDITAITALARPGPLHCGAATQFIARRLGREPVVPLHPSVAHLTADAQGLVVYQEQVMAIGREMGGLSWEDVSALRKAMSKSLGEEFFNQYWLRFKDGAVAKGIDQAEARRVWEQMCTFGSWAFNKSHAVSYALISYWCAMLKGHYPLEYAAACLRHPRDEDQSRRMLRELHVLGRWRITPVDATRSDLTWQVQGDELLGGLTNIKGIGPAKAKDILERRRAGKGMTPGLARTLANPVTPYDKEALFEGQMRWGALYADPVAHGIKSGPLWHIQDIQEDGTYLFIAKLAEKNLRDLNEYGNVVKRGGQLVDRNPLFLNLMLEDDTGSIICTIDRWKYPKLGAPILNEGKVGEWYVWRGEIRNGWRKVYIDKWRKLG